MAKYNREFLVPYLEDVCALHITDYFLAYKLYETQRQMSFSPGKQTSLVTNCHRRLAGPGGMRLTLPGVAIIIGYIWWESCLYCRKMTLIFQWMYSAAEDLLAV